MAYLEGGQIEYTSLTHSSLSMWAMSHYSKDCPDNPEVFSQLLSEFENNITTRISELVTNCNLHVIRLQPGALQSMPGTVPQQAHRDYNMHTYKEKFPDQLFIGFMPVTPDGMFLQVWNGPGKSKLVFSPMVTFCSYPETPFMQAGCAHLYRITTTDFISIFLYPKCPTTFSATIVYQNSLYPFHTKIFLYILKSNSLY
jgi:hypothetical protein